MATDNFLPSGYADARRAHQYAIAHQVTIMAACRVLVLNNSLVSRAVKLVRHAYLNGTIGKVFHDEFIAERDAAAQGHGRPPLPVGAAKPLKASQGLENTVFNEGNKAKKSFSQVFSTFAEADIDEDDYQQEQAANKPQAAKKKAKKNGKKAGKRKGASANGAPKTRAERAQSEERADGDANFEEDRSKIELDRDELGLISTYRFSILRRDHAPLTGAFSRSEMERIFSLYAHVTVNQLTADFPSYNAAEMRRILRAFNITKDRKIPPHIIEEQTPDEAAAFALNAKERVAYKKLDLNRGAFVEKQLRQSQQLVWAMQEEKDMVDRMATTVLERYISEGRLAPAPAEGDYRPGYRQERQQGQPALGFYGDSHFGKEFQTDQLRGRGRGTTKEILLERFRCLGVHLVDQLNRLDSSELALFNMGDIFESLLPDGMHAQHAAEMELLAEEQLMAALEAHEEMFQYIRTHATHGAILRITLHGLGGNHDRLGKGRDEDKRRTGAMIFYAMLQKVASYRFPGLLTINTYPEGVMSVVVGRLNVIGFHGDSSLAKVKTPELLNTFRSGDSSLYSIIASAHFHAMVVDEGHNYLRMTIGPVCSADDYSQNNLSKGSQPSAILMEAAVGYGADLSKKTLY